MTDTTSADAAGGTAGIASPPQLQGTINLAADWGSLGIQNVGPGTAAVEWAQGNPPLQGAQFDRIHEPRIPMPRPVAPTPLKPGPNSFDTGGNWYNAGISWSFTGAAGAGTLLMNLPGWPTGPDGWATAAEVQSPQQGSFQILGTTEPASWVMNFSIMANYTHVVPIVMMYVDGAFLATCVDGMEVVANGKVVSLVVDARGLPSTSQLSVGYTISPGQAASVSRRNALSSRPPSA
jgi:hypothetical protein